MTSFKYLYPSPYFSIMLNGCMWGNTILFANKLDSRACVFQLAGPHPTNRTLAPTKLELSTCRLLPTWTLVGPTYFGCTLEFRDFSRRPYETYGYCQDKMPASILVQLVCLIQKIANINVVADYSITGTCLHIDTVTKLVLKSSKLIENYIHIFKYSGYLYSCEDAQDFFTK